MGAHVGVTSASMGEEGVSARIAFFRFFYQRTGALLAPTRPAPELERQAASAFMSRTIRATCTDGASRPGPTQLGRVLRRRDCPGSVSRSSPKQAPNPREGGQMKTVLGADIAHSTTNL